MRLSWYYTFPLNKGSCLSVLHQALQIMQPMLPRPFLLQPHSHFLDSSSNLSHGWFQQRLYHLSASCLDDLPPQCFLQFAKAIFKYADSTGVFSALCKLHNKVLVASLAQSASSIPLGFTRRHFLGACADWLPCCVPALLSRLSQVLTPLALTFYQECTPHGSAQVTLPIMPSCIAPDKLRHSPLLFSELSSVYFY